MLAAPDARPLKQLWRSWEDPAFMAVPSLPERYGVRPVKALYPDEFGQHSSQPVTDGNNEPDHILRALRAACNRGAHRAFDA